MAYDYQFHDGFDTYGQPGSLIVLSGLATGVLLSGAWTQIFITSPNATTGVQIEARAALSPTGQSIRITCGGQNGAGGLSKTLPSSYARLIGGALIRSPLLTGRRCGIILGDAGADQVAITIEDSGQIGLRAGGASAGDALRGTLMALSDESVAALTPRHITFDITIDPAAGKAKIWLDGEPTSLDLTGIDTSFSGSSSANQLRFAATSTATSASSYLDVDDVFLRGYVSAGGGDTAPLDNPIVETAFPNADHAIDFTFGAAILGADDIATAVTAAAAANSILLRRYTPDCDGTLDEVSLIPGATSATAKFKAACYADAAGVAGSLLSDGVEVVGCLNGAALTSALNSPVALVAGTSVWIGFLVDSAVTLLKNDDGFDGWSAAAAYASGAPATAPALTPNQGSWVLFGSVSGVAADFWSVLDNDPHGGARSFMTSSSSGDEDLFDFPNLVSTPTTIHSVGVRIVTMRTDAGARTMDLRAKSGPTTGSGDNPGQTPAAGWATMDSFFSVDPDTLAAWNASGVNVAHFGYKIAS